jgi:hypothetical protein
MVVEHIAGLPVEEVLLAALAAAGPVIALAGWEISSRIKRLKARVRRRRNPPDPDATVDGDVKACAAAPRLLRGTRHGTSPHVP